MARFQTIVSVSLLLLVALGPSSVASEGYEGFGQDSITAEVLEKYAPGAIDPELRRRIESMLDIRGESAGVRMTYLKGALELMSSSVHHELIKTMIARLLEAHALERDITLNGYGSWTVRKEELERGLEPDECYVLGTEPPERPDIAIEVVWTHGGIDKLEVYRGLGVSEVWFWREGRIEVYVLRGDSYEGVERSELLPELDLEHLTGFLDRPSQTQTVREYRLSLRA